MLSLQRSMRRTGTATAVAAAVITLVAPSASATVNYGYLQSNSNCKISASNGSCNVYVKYGSTVTLTHPKSGGSVNNCPDFPNGWPIKNAIDSGKLNGRYVAVIWDSGFGSINCH
jgi:hypothetical protein